LGKNARGVARWSARVLGVVLVIVLASLLAVRIYGSRRLSSAEREFAMRVGPRASGTPAPVKFSDAENAALFLRAGAEAVVLPGDDKPRLGEATFVPLDTWTDKDRIALQRILTANQPALELLRHAGMLTRSNFGTPGSPNKDEELTVALLLKLISAQRLLFVDARVALLEHDDTRLLADVAPMAAMAAGLESEAPEVDLLIGMACEKILLSAVKEAVSDPSTDRRTLTKLEKSLVVTDLRAAWRRSNLWQQGVIEQHVAAVMSEPISARAQRVTLYGRFLEFVFGDIFRAQQLEIRADLIAAVDQPLGLDPAWSRRGVKRPRTIFDMFDVFDSVMFGQTARSAVGRVQSTLSLRRLGRVALAVRLQGLESGTYPKTLASFPDGLQPDPFAGKPLIYERRPSGAAEITVPDFEALWRRVSDASPTTEPAAWELPAPPPIKPKGSKN
jgi:hypothetical protein